VKLGFEESQSSYSSGSQSARTWTEAWVRAWAYCPHCGNARISSFPNNSPLADFFCGSCSEEFELKSQRGKFGAKVLDGEFNTKCQRLAANNNPNLLLMNYDLHPLRSSTCSSCRSIFCPRYHRGAAAALADGTARRLGRFENPARPGPGVGQDTYRAERHRSRKGAGSRGMAENAVPQR
jgi:hypothetical protein